MSVVVGVVLAAGSSRRLGTPKQELPLGDTTLLGRVVREAEASSLDRVVVVTQEMVGEADRGGSCSASLRSGLEAAGRCDAVMLLLADMPGVDAPLIDAVRAAWEENRPWGLVTRYDDGLGHPLVFGAGAFPALRALHGDKGVWKLVEAQPELVLEARVARRRPRDVDTWADYAAVLRTLV